MLNDYPGYIREHRTTQDVLQQTTAPRGLCLTNTYWAILPFLLGSEVVKYRLEPMVTPEGVPDDDPNYLATDLRNRLRERAYLVATDRLPTCRRDATRRTSGGGGPYSKCPQSAAYA